MYDTRVFDGVLCIVDMVVVEYDCIVLRVLGVQMGAQIEATLRQRLAFDVACGHLVYSSRPDLQISCTVT